MKQPGILLLYGIVTMSIICAAAATTIPEPEVMDCKTDVSYTKISRNDITISWEKSCFKNASTYRVELNVIDHDGCNKNDISCEGESLCQTSIRSMGCTSKIKPCYNITMKVIGNEVEKTSLPTHLAPYFNSTDWKLNSSNIDKDTLNARWGPPDDLTYERVNCADTAMVSATCNDTDGKNLDINRVVYGLDPTDQGNATILINNCRVGNVTLTVTYLSGDVPTETKSSISLPKRSGSINVYPLNVLLFSAIAMILGILQFNF